LPLRCIYTPGLEFNPTSSTATLPGYTTLVTGMLVIGMLVIRHAKSLVS